MPDFAMIRKIAGQNLEGAIRLLNQLQWNIRVVEAENSLSVGGSPKLLFKTTSREASMHFCTVWRSPTPCCLKAFLVK